MGASELSTPGWEHVGDVDVRSSFGGPARSLRVWRRKRDGAVNIDVPYSDLILDDAAVAGLRELLDRAAMPGQESSPHKCEFPVQPPDGTILSPGPCRTCGKSFEVALAETRASDAQAALGAARKAEARDE